MQHNLLSGKNILFIGVQLYQYPQIITNKLENTFGATVSFYPERDTSIFYGLINRIFPDRIEQYQDFYYNKIFKKLLEEKFDYFFVIRGFKMPLWFVQKIKENNPNIKTIYYQWDSNVNSPFINLEKKYDIIGEFDSTLSFDFRDVEENETLKYCPLFYTDEIKGLKINKDKNIKYDLFYFGSYLPERYNGLLQFMEYAVKNNYEFHSYFYMPLRYYIIERLKGVKINRRLIKTKPMSRSKYLELLDQAKCVVDVSNEKQTGLAMRVIESFGASKKLVTTNKWILKEKSYNQNQAVVIDISNIDIPAGFLTAPIKSEVSYDYSLEQWLRNIFGSC